jgi:hypothetical protein
MPKVQTEVEAIHRSTHPGGTMTIRTALSALTLIALPAFAASGPPDISVRQVVWVVIQLLGVALVLGLLHYFVKAAPFINAPLKAMLLWVIIGLGVLLAVYVILAFIGL